MSNPAVIKLQSGHIGRSKVWLDDNFGEAIHIHIDDYRVDLTVEEFRQLYIDTCTTVTSLVNVEGFDASQMDPVFVSLMLWPILPRLESVFIDNIRLESLLAPYHSKIFSLAESVGVKALQGKAKGEDPRKSNHIGQTEMERMESILDSVKQNGYPYNNNYIVLYGDDNIIRDGQHRASCLYYLYGNIEIPVMRLHFKDYKTPYTGLFGNSVVFLYYKKFLRRGKQYLKKMKLIRLAAKNFNQAINRYKIRTALDSRIVKVFESK